MLYDDRADITLEQLERIYQGIVWLADTVVMPSYARPSPLLDGEVQSQIKDRLAELAEAGYIGRWNLAGDLSNVAAARWWPGSSEELSIDRDMYAELNRGIEVGVELYREDILRGVGHKAGSMMSGISEFVSLRDSLWTVGLARFAGAEYLLSSDTRSLALSAPVKRLAALGAVTGPVSETIMQMHGMGALSVLTVRDIERLRRFKPATRTVISQILKEVRSDTISSLDQSTYFEAAVERTREYYAQLLAESVRSASRSGAINDALGLGISIAGTIFPPLGTLAFAQPLMSWSPHGRSTRRLVVFMAKLKKRIDKRRRELRATSRAAISSPAAPSDKGIRGSHVDS